MTEYENTQQDEFIDTPRLQNKTIEPDHKVSRFANRNLQLGKVPSKLLVFMNHRIDIALRYEKMPLEYGGFLTQQFAEDEMEIINLQMIASGSSDGFVREINATQRKINENKYSEVKLGRFGRMRNE